MRAGPQLSTPGFSALQFGALLAYTGAILALMISAVVMVSPEHVRQAWNDTAIWDAVTLSLVASFISTLLAVVVAAPAGYLLSRRRFPGYAIVDMLIDLPIVLPPLVMGLCILIFFNTSIGKMIDRSLPAWWQEMMGHPVTNAGLFVYQPAGVVLVQFLVGCAFAIRVVKAGFDSLDRRCEQVAMTLGATPFQTFWKVALPLSTQSLVAGAVITWARVFGLFGPILLVCGTMRSRVEVMPTTIFLEMSIGHIEVSLVVALFMIVLSVAVLTAFKRLGGRGYLW